MYLSIDLVTINHLSIYLSICLSIYLPTYQLSQFCHQSVSIIYPFCLPINTYHLFISFYILLDYMLHPWLSFRVVLRLQLHRRQPLITLISVNSNISRLRKINSEQTSNYNTVCSNIFYKSIFKLHMGNIGVHS